MALAAELPRASGTGITDTARERRKPSSLGLYPSVKGIGGARSPITYRRFATAAEAVRFAVEEFPAVRTLGAWMQVGEGRCNCDEI
jgi:hypothetical protein